MKSTQVNTQAEAGESGVLDILKLLVAGALVLGGLFAYYYYPAWPLPVRVLCVLGGTIAGVGVGLTSTQGRRLWAFIQGSRIEIRKVVWPTREETTQTAIAVFVFTLVMAVFFWGLDAFLLWVTKTLVGSGA